MYRVYRDLTPQQQRYVQEYMVDRHPRQAAIRAGYSPDSIDVTVRKLMRSPAVRAAIEERERLIARKVDVRAERIIAELARIALADMGDFVELRAIRDAETGQERIEARLKPWDGRVDTAAIQEITVKPSGEVKLKLYDKRAAAETLARMIGAFREGGDGAGEMVVRFADPDEADGEQKPQAQLYTPLWDDGGGDDDADDDDNLSGLDGADDGDSDDTIVIDDAEVIDDGETRGGGHAVTAADARRSARSRRGIYDSGYEARIAESSDTGARGCVRGDADDDDDSRDADGDGA